MKESDVEIALLLGVEALEEALENADAALRGEPSAVLESVAGQAFFRFVSDRSSDEAKATIRVLRAEARARESTRNS